MMFVEVGFDKVDHGFGRRARRRGDGRLSGLEEEEEERRRTKGKEAGEVG